jgi:curved DNA-binding protein CbpA
MPPQPDHFAVLGQPRRPWLPPDELKETFHRTTAATHPDVSGNDQAASAVNAAFAVLRDPASRLRHLLELEHPEILAQQSNVPAALAETFLRLATLRRAVGAFVEQQAATGSALGQALRASERFSLQHDVEKEQRLLEAAHAHCLEQLEALDAAWEKRDASTVERAAALQQELAYLAKWSWQLRECLFQLTT